MYGIYINDHITPFRSESSQIHVSVILWHNFKSVFVSHIRKQTFIVILRNCCLIELEEDPININADKLSLYHWMVHGCILVHDLHPNCIILKWQKMAGQKNEEHQRELSLIVVPSIMNVYLLK